MTEITDTSNSCTSLGGFNLPNPTCMQKILIDNHAGASLASGTDIPRAPFLHLMGGNH